MDEIFESPMKDHPLGLAARYNDADVEEKGFQAVFPALDLELQDVLYISEQRALRVLTGNQDTSKAIPVALSAAQLRELVTLQSCIMDGIVIGWRGHKISMHDKGYLQPTPTAAADLIRDILHDFTEDEAKAILKTVTDNA